MAAILLPKQLLISPLQFLVNTVLYHDWLELLYDNPLDKTIHSSKCILDALITTLHLP